MKRFFNKLEHLETEIKDTEHDHGTIGGNIAHQASEISKFITYVQLGEVDISQRNAKIIVHLFKEFLWNYGVVGLEELKNEIDDERDTLDLVDLIKHLPKGYSEMLLIVIHRPFLFNKFAIENTPYEFKVISDVDNTAIEVSWIAPAQYTDKEIVPGFLPFVKGISGKCTTTTFISARPKHMEFRSIADMSDKIRKHAEMDGFKLRFSFQTGTIASLISLAGAEFTGEMCESSRKRLLTKAYRKLGDIKYKNFLKLKAVYPGTKFVFFGDDTQGDIVFAEKLVERDPDSFAIIRCLLGENSLIKPSINPRIIYHSSYYDAFLQVFERKFLSHKSMETIFNLMEIERKYSKNCYFGNWVNISSDALVFEKIRHIYKN